MAYTDSHGYFFFKFTREHPEICGSLLQLFDALPDTRERLFFAEHFQSFEQRRRIFLSTDCDANRLEHLPSLETEFLRGGAQRLIQRIMF